MAQFANGSFRLANRSGGRLVTWTDAIQYDQLDNTASPFTVFEYVDSPRRYGTINDVHVVVPRDLVVHGSAAETLELQYLHSAAATTINSGSCTASLSITEITRNPFTGRPETQPRTLTKNDRLNASADTGGIHDTDGWPDGTLNVANQWSTVMRFRPRHGVNWILEGRSNFTLDGA